MAVWRTRPVAEVCTLVTDGSHFSPSTTPTGFPYITVRDIKDGQIDFENCAFVSEASFDELRRNGCSPSIGDVLFSKDGTVGKVALVSSPRAFVVLSSLAILRPNLSLIDPAYLSYVLMSPAFLEAAIGQKTGVAIRRIILKNLKQIPVPYPPLAEQRRIVAILDEAFEGIATAKAHAERNLRNARELSESLVEETLTQVKARSGEQRLGDLCQIKTGKKDVNQGNPDGQFPFFTCAAQHTYSDSYSFDTEALLVAGNGNVGQVSYYHGKFEAYQRTYVLMGFKNVQAGYLFRALDRRLSARVSKQKLGNTMPYIKIGMLTEFQVPVPSIEEQERITKQLNFVADQIKNLETAYQAKLAALDELKQSLLHQAFSGAL